MFIVKREQMPAIHSVEVSQKRYQLGILKDFRRHPQLSAVMPENGRFSISWVYLKEAEVLENHQHDTLSMIIITEGCGYVRGDLEATVDIGDVVVVPAGNIHGFIGCKPNGFWGLSLQFEGAGLYEILMKRV